MSMYETVRNIGVAVALTFGPMAFEKSLPSAVAQESPQSLSPCRLATPEDDPEKVIHLTKWRNENDPYWNGVLVLPEGFVSVVGIGSGNEWYPFEGIDIVYQDEVNQMMVFRSDGKGFLGYYGNISHVALGDFSQEFKTIYEGSHYDLLKSFMCDMHKLTPTDEDAVFFETRIFSPGE